VEFFSERVLPTLGLALSSVAFHVHSQAGRFSTILKNGETQKLATLIATFSYDMIYANSIKKGRIL
jgi:hypothetical protein